MRAAAGAVAPRHGLDPRRACAASLLAVAATSGEELGAASAIDRSLAVGAGLAPPGWSWAFGHAWRALYPAVVERLGGDGLRTDDWRDFLRLAGELERLAFGPPPVNAAKLLALIEAGIVDLSHLRGGRLAASGGTLLRSAAGERSVGVVVDAVLAPPVPRAMAGCSPTSWPMATRASRQDDVGSMSPRRASCRHSTARVRSASPPSDARPRTP